MKQTDDMKTLKRNITFIIFLAVTFVANAAEVSQERALAVAKLIIMERVIGINTDVKEINTVTKNGKAIYYVINFIQGGWALVSADDTTAPLIGYSDTGTYNIFSQAESNKWMMDKFVGQIEQNARTRKHADAAWQQSYGHTTRAASKKVEPIITVKWNQGKPYNKYCPSDQKGATYVGCVAVAMAQAMSVWQYPSRPQGSHSYTHDTYGTLYVNYDNEPDYNWNNIMTGANNKDELARLLYHVGISIDMNYGTDGSGTQTSYIPGALKKYFGYPNSVTYYSRDKYSDNWEELILNELYSGRAVCYSGHDPKKNYGHCFNLDGFDGSFFHVNWGWGGANDGYFPLDGLRDNTMDMDYTSGQGVVVGIRPPSEHPCDIMLTHNSVSANMPAGTVVGQVIVDSEAKDPVYEYKIKGEYSVLLHTYLKAPFEIVDDELRTTEPLSMDNGNRNINITVTNTKNNFSYSKDFTIYVTDPSGITRIENQHSNDGKIYTLDGKKIINAHKKNIYIINGKKIIKK